MGDFSLVYLLCRLISSPHYFTIIGFNSHHLFLSANILLSFPLHSLWTALSLSIRTPRPLSPPLSLSIYLPHCLSHSHSHSGFDSSLPLQGNPACKQIPWDNDETKFLAFKEGRTGYPYIDAIMTQLRTEGVSNITFLFYFI